MGITYGDHLIDSGYYDITPEQEREVYDAEEQYQIEEYKARIVDLEAELAEARAQIAAKDAEIERIKDSNQHHYDEGYKHGLAAPAREKGTWPDWGDRPDGFDGPGGAE